MNFKWNSSGFRQDLAGTTYRLASLSFRKTIQIKRDMKNFYTALLLAMAMIVACGCSLIQGTAIGPTDGDTLTFVGYSRNMGSLQEAEADAFVNALWHACCFQGLQVSVDEKFKETYRREDSLDFYRSFWQQTRSVEAEGMVIGARIIGKPIFEERQSSKGKLYRAELIIEINETDCHQSTLRTFLRRWLDGIDEGDSKTTRMREMIRHLIEDIDRR